ncbi:hypothetical protein SLEP1_g11079 [Rubroshorea leprosula]|uniref:Uncharacterized protein n=1 Tax=Rubroshorea leprosula TaxID=152421 RepID=A0AAV5IG11_9ROSI|nr:hypothetical protein SLEP1_g11079 [Rubroshorea leprosula]
MSTRVSKSQFKLRPRELAVFHTGHMNMRSCILVFRTLRNSSNLQPNSPGKSIPTSPVLNRQILSHIGATTNHMLSTNNMHRSDRVVMCCMNV